jgi:GT2 family glycosyltransferase
MQIEASIIIPAWNKWEYTRNCFESLVQTIPLQSTEVIVVDNGSTDETPMGLKQFIRSIPLLKIVRNEENLGFAKACNQGANQANGEYLVFLNNDTVATAGWLEELLKTAKNDPTVGAVGSMLLYPDGKIQHAGVGLLYQKKHKLKNKIVGPISALYHLHVGETPKPADNLKPQLMPALTGACLLVPKVYFKEIGGFDEIFKNGFEDVDLCFRLRTQGLKMIFCPTSVLFHYESITPKRHDYDEENFLYLLSKWSAYLGGNENPPILNGRIPLEKKERVWLDLTGFWLYDPESIPNLINTWKAAAQEVVPVVWDAVPFPNLEVSIKFFFLKIIFVLPFEKKYGFFKIFKKGAPTHWQEKSLHFLNLFSIRIRPTAGFEEDFTVRFFRMIFKFFGSKKSPIEIPKGERFFLVA